MAKSIIVYGVKGGKTRFAQRIADHFNIATFHQGDPFTIYQTDELAFIESDSFLNMWRDAHFEVRSFQSVADEINATISLTDWQSGPPPMVGEWIAGTSMNNNRRRWWNGACWSGWYVLTDAADEVARCQGMHAVFDNSEIKWRGLSSEPIKVTE